MANNMLMLSLALAATILNIKNNKKVTPSVCFGVILCGLQVGMIVSDLLFVNIH